MDIANDELINNLINAGKREDKSDMKDNMYSNLITDYKDNKYSVRELSRKYGLSRYKINKFLKSHKINKHSKDRLKKMVKAYRKYHSMAKVGKLFGVTKADIWVIFKDHGIKRDKSTNEKAKELKEKQFNEEHQTTSKPLDPFKHLQYVHKTLEYYKKKIYLLNHFGYKAKYEKAKAKIKKLERAINQL